MLDARTRQGHRLRFWAVVAVLGAFVGHGTPLRRCSRSSARGWTAWSSSGAGSATGSGSASPPRTRRPRSTATLSQAGGQQPEQAWDALGSAAQAGRTREEFLASWSDVAMAERVAPMRRTANRFNWFTFDYRVFRTPAPA